MILHDLFESRMSELDIEYQDWKNLSPVAFHSRYKMTKDQWYAKHASLVPAEGMAEGWFSAKPGSWRNPKPGVDDAGRELMKQDRQAHPDMDDYSWQLGWIFADGDKDVKAAYKDAYYDNPTVPSPPEPRSFKLGFEARRNQAVAEGFQKFGKYDPYWVCINGNKWKRFETYEHARAVHDKLEKKLRDEGSDKKVSLLAADDVKEGLRDPKDNPCWKGYKPVGTKQKGGRTVPNCVPKK